jgi:serine/threonine protein kinase
MMGLDTSKDAVLSAVGNYDLLEKIAEGGMGAIYRGRHRETGQIVAIKIMPSHMATNPVLLKRFEQEFRAASRLDHPNIVRALDYGDNGNMPYLVMEFVEGKSLGQLLEDKDDHRLPEQEAIKIIAQVAQGLHRAHKQNLVHRDVKPDNILVTSDGVAKLADLGLVKETDTDLNLTKTGRGLGTPHFMAPEQFRNAKDANIQCDIYSLGATLYQMVTGVLPFQSNGPLDAWMKKVHNDLDPPRNLVPTLSERVNWAILRAMKSDPNERPTSCREFVEDLTGHPTRRSTTVERSTGTHDQWYLRYTDEEGVEHQVRGSTGAIRRGLQDGKLGDASNITASRVKGGEYESLKSFPQFRDLIVATTTPSGQSIAPLAPSRMAAREETVAGLSSSRLTTASGLGAGTEDEATEGVIPHIALDDHYGSASLEWLKWLFLVGLAAASAVVAFFFLRGK